MKEIIKDQIYMGSQRGINIKIRLITWCFKILKQFDLLSNTWKNCDICEEWPSGLWSCD